MPFSMKFFSTMEFTVVSKEVQVYSPKMNSFIDALLYVPQIRRISSRKLSAYFLYFPKRMTAVGVLQITEMHLDAKHNYPKTSDPGYLFSSRTCFIFAGFGRVILGVRQ